MKVSRKVTEFDVKNAFQVLAGHLDDLALSALVVSVDLPAVLKKWSTCDSSYTIKMNLAGLIDGVQRGVIVRPGLGARDALMFARFVENVDLAADAMVRWELTSLAFEGQAKAAKAKKSAKVAKAPAKPAKRKAA